jgi:SAM-dependent methyltransferase
MMLSVKASAAARWDDEYRAGRYVGEPPVAFVADIVDAVQAHRPPDDVGLYIGCGNGRNYIPLIEAGLDLIGIDVSQVAVEQLATRLPQRASRLIHGDLAALPEGQTFGSVIAIQVFQHGTREETHSHVRRAIRRLAPGGLFCVRVNAVSTDIEFRTRCSTGRSVRASRFVTRRGRRQVYRFISSDAVRSRA